MTFQEQLAVAIGLSALTAWLVASGLARAGFPVPDMHRRIGNVDGLRGFLALSVMAYHFHLWVGVVGLGRPWGAFEDDPFRYLGQGAVSLFFMITGLVFYRQVRAGFDRTDWVATYLSRLCRILPAVIASVLAVCLVIACRHGVGGTWGGNLRAILQWITAWDEPPLLGDADAGRINAYVFWSLRAEWTFYLLILPALALGRQLTRRIAPAWAMPAGLMLLSSVAHRLPALGQWPQLLMLFGIGMIGAELRAALGPERRIGPAMELAGIGLVVAAAALWPAAHSFPRLLVYAVVFGIAVGGGGLLGLLATRGARVLGEMSFSIYILHGVVLDIAFVDVIPRLGWRSPGLMLALMPCVTVAVVLVSAASFLWIERPGIALGRRILLRRGAARGAEAKPLVQIAP